MTFELGPHDDLILDDSYPIVNVNANGVIHMVKLPIIVRTSIYQAGTKTDTKETKMWLVVDLKSTYNQFRLRVS